MFNRDWMKILGILILFLLLANIVFADNNMGVGTSVSVVHKTALEVAIDNFFNNQSLIIWPLSYVLDRKVTQFEFYIFIFFIMFFIATVLISAIKLKKRRNNKNIGG
jgi:phosphotransferase system  glucose/maltose/N-acetylglucosamine-specific IIC component